MERDISHGAELYPFTRPPLLPLDRQIIQIQTRNNTENYRVKGFDFTKPITTHPQDRIRKVAAVSACSISMHQTCACGCADASLCLSQCTESQQPPKLQWLMDGEPAGDLSKGLKGCTSASVSPGLVLPVVCFLDGVVAGEGKPGVS